jgi:sialic acid synthase
VGGDEPCFVVAEVGQNHQGEEDIAMELIRTAAGMGCDCVKFQKSYAKEKFTESALSRTYDSPHSFGTTYGQHKAKLELTDEQFRNLQRFAANEGILFTASAMDTKSVHFLAHIDVPFFKIGSGDTNNYPLIKVAAGKGKPIVVSTGMQGLDVVHYVYELSTQMGADLCLLHCVSAYPTPHEDVHLNIIPEYRRIFPEAVIGYSGHETGTAISVAAVALGAKILERHLTLDKGMKGNDHSCSLEPWEFEGLINQVRTVETALGSRHKARRESENACWQRLGKTLVAAADIPRGALLTEQNMDIKVAEPRGIEAQEYYQILGKTSCRDIKFDESILSEDVQ